LLSTRLTELLGIDHPVVSAPMARMSGGRLAGAVSAAGGLGTFGAALVALRIDPAYVREQVQRIRSHTDRPFGIGFVTHNLPASEETFAAALEEGPDVMLFSFGDPSPWLVRARRVGARTICQVRTVTEAVKAADAGADVLAVQGNEAGGHTGRANLLPLLVQTLDAVPGVPVIAAGGITNGRSLAAVLAAGADGAWVGTLFTAVEEAEEMSAAHRRAVLASDGRDTVASNVYDVLNAKVFGDLPWPDDVVFRTRRNDFVDAWRGREAELGTRVGEFAADYANALKRDDPALRPLIFGEGAGAIAAIKPAGEVLDALCRQAEHHLRVGAALAR
jgi:nitronate monooxygenase